MPEIPSHVPSVDLSLVTVEQMADELARRYSGVVLLLTRESEEESVLVWHHRGGRIRALGAAHSFLHRRGD